MEGSSPVVLWRCFPWDPAAPAGQPFSLSYVSPGQTAGRFDLQDRPSVWYLAESPAHAVGEQLAPFRGRRLRPSFLLMLHRRLALAPVMATPALVRRIADCTDPAVLTALDLRPDRLAHHDRQLTQAVARQIHTAGYAGLRWWSAITGAWHSTVLFLDRIGQDEVTFGTPEHLAVTHPAVAEAIELLGLRRP